MTDPLLLETAERALAATCTHEAIQAAERDGWAPGVWARVEEVGLDQVAREGGSVADALEVLRVAGRHAAPVPLAETDLLAGWLLSGAGLPVGEGPLTVVPGRPEDRVAVSGGRISGVAHRVPWARAASRVVALVQGSGGEWLVAAVSSDALSIEGRVNLAGEPRDTVTFDGPASVAAAAPGVDAEALRHRGALTRAMLMAGALEAMSRLTVGYTNERVQFGRPVARFQAVQRHLVDGAQDAVLVGMAASAAARAAERGDARFETASAKLLANQAAFTATRAAHQAHGAMGMTREYPLHHLSRRLWAWRSEYGDERFWSTRLGAAVARAGADGLYPSITGGSEVLSV